MTIYLGLNRESAKKYHATFSPIIQIIPYAKSCPHLRFARRYLNQATHILLTSPSSVSLFFSRMKQQNHRSLRNKHYLCIGRNTAKRIQHFLPQATCSFPSVETAEGMFPLLLSLPKEACILYPHSSIARPAIKNFLYENKFSFFDYSHYSVKKVSLNSSIFSHYHTVILTSPSCVKFYAKLFPQLPPKRHLCQGPITQKTFHQTYRSQTGELLEEVEDLDKKTQRKLN